MAKKLAFRCVRERSVVGKLVDFADVVEEGAGKKKIAIDLWIVAADQVTGADKRDDVIEEASDVSVVQGLRRGSIAVSGGDFGIGHERLNQSPEMRILK